jgi:hypothetical protein
MRIGGSYGRSLERVDSLLRALIGKNQVSGKLKVVSI